VSPVCHDPDFDLVEGSRQMVLTLSILVRMISEEIINKVYKSIQNLTKLETIDMVMTVRVSLATKTCFDPAKDLIS
jgi:hypothetical protein